MFQLDGKTAVVIGGAGGLGEFCATAMASQGARVAIASRTLRKLNEVIKNHNADDIGYFAAEEEREIKVVGDDVCTILVAIVKV
jgi:NAD(P)-dependent dehydrogenase (short-subunit alcohol dehydrogenase family)